MVRQIVSDILVVPLESIEPDTPLIAELGAESIDFLDLVFRLEEWLKVKIPINRWDTYVQAQMPDRNYDVGITSSFIVGFVSDVVETKS